MDLSNKGGECTSEAGLLPLLKLPSKNDFSILMTFFACTVLAKKKASHKKVILGSKKMVSTYVSSSCLKAVICELMLLELVDLLGSFLAQECFKCGKVSIFSWKYFSFFYSLYLEDQKAIQNHHYFRVGGWVIEWCERIEFGKIMMIFNWFLN